MIVDDFGKVVNHNLPDDQWQTIPVVVISDLGELMLEDGNTALVCPILSLSSKEKRGFMKYL